MAVSLPPLSPLAAHLLVPPHFFFFAGAPLAPLPALGFSSSALRFAGAAPPAGLRVRGSWKYHGMVRQCYGLSPMTLPGATHLKNPSSLPCCF